MTATDDTGHARCRAAATLRRERHEGIGERGDVRVAAVRILVETAQDHRLELGRRSRPLRAQRRRRVHRNHRAQSGRAGRVEDRRGREQLEEDRAERPDVRAEVDVLQAAHLLGRHVERRAHHRVGRGQVRRVLVDGLRDAEVEDLHARRAVGRLGDEEVLRLEVAMDDAELVRLADRLARLEEVVDGLVDRQRAPRAEDLREVAAGEVLHHDVRRAVRERADLEDADDVLALNRCGGAGLADETSGGAFVPWPFPARGT